MSTSPKKTGRPPQPPVRRSVWPMALFWSSFVLCAGASFAGGFWFTYRYTSQVGVRGLNPAVAPPPGALATPGPTPVPTATPQDLFAAEPSPSPSTTASSEDLFGKGRRTQEPATPQPSDEPAEEPTPEPTPQDSYRVQVGSYDNREAAESMVQELLSAGIQAVVVYDGTRYHAQVGAFTTKDRAYAVADEVNAKGYTVTIRH